MKTLLLAGLAIFAPASFSQTSGTETTSVSGPFDAVISRRGDPGAQPMALLGTMKLQVAKDGTFKGVLIPATYADGTSLPALVFRGDPLTPDLSEPQSIEVEGQITGRSVSLVIKYPGPKAQRYIYGIGVAAYDLSKERPSDPDQAFAAGVTVGPDIGDQGDWGQKIGATGGTADTGNCYDVYVRGVYHCTICQQN